MQVELILENCDSITFNSKHIEHLQTEKEVGNNYFDYLNLIVNKEGDIPYKRFDDSEPISPFQRITQHNDITQIVIINNSNEESHYYIDYEKMEKEKLGSPNKYQKSYIDEETGNLIIIIDSREICF